MTHSLRASYDEVPYPASPYPQTHPARLAAIATLLGMSPPPVERSRVLEIGCANGSNLIPMAVLLPESQFVGIDLSERQVAGGRELVQRLGLTNIELRTDDFTSDPEKLGTFDYIIAHGVYSWVPPEIADALLGLCHRQLSPRGIAYVSYNTVPGWEVRAMLRELLQHRYPEGVKPTELAAARAYLVEIHALAAVMPGSFPPLITASIDAMLGQSNDYWFHDLLETEQHPVSFQEFSRRLKHHQLQYVGDAEFHTMFGRGLNADALARIRSIAANRIESEQLMDVMIYRSFRQSILTHASVDLAAQIAAERLEGMSLIALLEPIAAAAGEPAESPNSSTQGQVYRTHRGLTLSQRDPTVIAALGILLSAYPAAVPARDLTRLVREQIGADPVNADLLLALVTLYSYDALDVRTESPRIAARATTRPVGFLLARIQAETSRSVTNLLHDQVHLTADEQMILAQLDGTQTAQEITQELVLCRQGQEAVDADTAVAAVASILSRLARAALLMA